MTRREMADVRSKKQEVGSKKQGVNRRYLFSFFLFFLMLPALLAAQNIPDQPSGHVNDYAHLLSSSQRQRLETKLRNYRDTTTTVIAIATINSLGGRSVQQVGTKLFNQWNLWQGKKDNGVLILIAKQEHRIRIEVGYGLEGAVTDLMSGRIIRNVLNPAFKKGRYYQGLDEATTDIIQLASGEFKGHLKKKRQSDDNTASYIIFFLFIAYVIYASSRKGGGKNGGRRTFGPGGAFLLGSMLGGGFGGRGGGGFGGGGGGFGGFSGGGGFGSGGGGASGGW